MPFLEYASDFGRLPQWLVLTGGAVLGLVAGSYLATIFVRWPQGLSANRGRSRCDSCGRRLAWYELVPLASYVCVAGRCRTCRATIPVAHPLIESACALLGAYFFVAQLPALAPLAWLLLLLALFDARLLWLPDALVAALALIALLVPPFASDADLRQRLLAGAIGFAGLWLVGTGFRRLAGRDGLGGGDPKLFGAIGLWIGARDLPALMITACAIGLVDAALRWLRGTGRRDMHLPLGTYLCIASLGFAALQPFRAMLLS